MPVAKDDNCPACRRLEEENARLKKLLVSHGICWDEVPVEPFPSSPVPLPPASSHQLTTPEKIALFRRLFRGREDVYPRRWESAKGASGYSPVCGNEWKPGMCCKPKVKCGDCAHRLLLLVVAPGLAFLSASSVHLLVIPPMLAPPVAKKTVLLFERIEMAGIF